MTVPREYLEKLIQNMKQYIQGSCCELLFNLDEVGNSQWEERKIRKIVVPRSADKQCVEHKVPRTTHMTLLGCVSVAEDALTSMLIMKNNILNDFEKTYVHERKDLIIRQINLQYINYTLFMEYISTILIPYVNYIQQNEVYSQEKAVVLMDNSSCYFSEEILRIPAKNKIWVITYPSHTSNIFQALG